MKRTRVAVYARFSCDRQRDESIEDQLFEANSYCSSHQGYIIVAQYCDYAMTGRSDDRPQFLKMIEDAKAGSFDVILVWKMDRFARNIEEQYYYLHIMREAGVEFEAVRQNITGDSIEATSNKALNALFAQIRSQQSAEDTMRGMSGKARKTQYLGDAVFGYGHQGDEITVNEGQAEIVRKIHSDYLAGKSVCRIAEELNEMGVRTMQGAKPNYNFVLSILKSEKYAGVYRWGKKRDSRGNVVIGQDGSPVPLVRVEGGMPEIVSMATKRAVMARIGRRRRNAAKADYDLSGKLWCATCGNPMHGMMARGSKGTVYHYYACKGKSKSCSGSMQKERIEGAVSKSVRDMLTDQVLCEHLAKRHVEWQGDNAGRSSVSAARKELREVQRARERLVAAVEDGMPYTAVKERMDAIMKQEEGIERRIDELESLRDGLTEDEIMLFFAAARNGYLSDSELIGVFVSKVWLYESEAVVIMNVSADDTSLLEVETSLGIESELGDVPGGKVRLISSWCPR